MADSYGGLQFPAQMPDGVGVNADPPDRALECLGGYLAAVLNDRIGPMWSVVAPGLQRVVKRVFTAKPENVMLNESNLPALFLWRGRVAFEQMADDYRIGITPISVLWLIEPGDVIKRERYLKMQGPIAMAIDAAINEGRDPAWIEDGDPDETAAEYGSVLMTRASFIRPPFSLSGEEVPITVMPEKGDPVTYHAINNQVCVTEQYVREPSTRRFVRAHTATMTAGALTLQSQQPLET